MPSPCDGRDGSASRSRAWGVALACWVAFVWGHSLVQGPDSALESGRVVALLRPLFEAAGVCDVDLMTFVVRKCAHFTEYAVLGALAAGLWRSLSSRRRPPAWLASLGVALVPVVDECIQLFVPGRSGALRDVLIDLAGALVGALASAGVRRVRRRLRKVTA